MVIQGKKRIRSLDPYARMIPPGDHLVIGVVNPSKDQLQNIGFSADMESGESVLPAPVGNVSMYNAEGKEIVHKDQPMETAHRTREWSWTEWHGPHPVEQSSWVDVPYQRYPRSYLAPPGVELTLTTDTDGNMVVRTPVIRDWRNDKDTAIHAVNLLLELFGECVFYDSDMKRLISAPVKKLNWRVLPPGERPFRKLKEELEAVLSQVKDGNRAFTEHRLETVNEYKPDFAAVGMGGFAGYVIFGFKERDIYVLESILYGNATYVLGEQWEELSKKTKAEILNRNLHKDRLVHHKEWARDLAGLFR